MALPRLRSPALLLLVLAGAAALLLAGAGGTPLLDPDEARFARTSVEMLQSGDLVIPRFGGEPRLVKPPLIHWVQSFFFSIFGVSERVARLHAALATLGSVALAGWIGRRRFGGEGGVWTALVLATTPLVLVPGRIGTVDALLAVHVLAAIALDLGAPEREGGYRAPVLGGLLGLAFLAKGPVGVALPLLVMLAGRTAARREVLPSLGAVVQVIAAWCVVVLPWGLAFLQRIGGDTTAALLRSEVLDRYFAGTTHVEPPWFYAEVVALGFLPWLAPLVVALVRTWHMRKEPVARTALYVTAGLIAGLAFLSLSRGKDAHYILPLAPLVAILVTWELGRELEAPRERTLGAVLLAASVVAAAAVLGMAATFQLGDESRVVAVVGMLSFAVAAIPAGIGVFSHRPRWTYGAAAAATAATFLAATLLLFPAIGRRKSAAALIDAVPELASGRPLVTVAINVPSLTFYLGRLPEVIESSALEGRILGADDPLFVIADVDLATAPRQVLDRLQEVGRAGKFVVFEGR